MKTNVTIELGPEELKELIRQAVREEFSKVQSPGPPEQKFISRKEAKEILNVSSDTTLIQWERLGKLIPHKAGRKIMYEESKVRSIMSKFGRD